MIVIGTDKLYIKAIDLENGTITFTESKKEAMTYQDSWKPGVELDMLKHNFYAQYGDKLEDMRVRNVRTDTEATWDDCDVETPHDEDEAEGFTIDNWDELDEAPWGIDYETQG